MTADYDDYDPDLPDCADCGCGAEHHNAGELGGECLLCGIECEGYR